MQHFTATQLRDEELTFNNEDNLSEEAFELQIDNIQRASWDSPFHLSVNGQMVASFRSFNGLQRRAIALIEANNLVQVEA